MLTSRRSPTDPGARARNPARTRGRLLQSAFAEIHRTGFRTADLDTILTGAGVTKGAMYHHFAGKQAIGYAVVDEVLAPMTRAKWVAPLAAATDPVARLRQLFAATPHDMADLDLGCPLANLTQEMAPHDPGFRGRVAGLFEEWRTALADALRRGQAAGRIARNIDCDAEATFLVALFEGYLMLTRSARDPRMLAAGAERLVRHLDSLAPPRSQKLRPRDFAKPKRPNRRRGADR